MRSKRFLFKFIARILCFTLFFNAFFPVRPSTAQVAGFTGSVVTPIVSEHAAHLSATFNPVVLFGVKTCPQDPFRLDFVVNSGDEKLTHEQLTQESEKLVRYFLACLTVSEKDLWVNLSPYESNRIIPESLGQTEAGQELLAQDYLLKKIAASLIYPDGDLGKKFWEKIYRKAYERYGTTQIPVNTFNKIWIVPESAVIYHHLDKAIITEARLKVMLEQDFLAMKNSVTDKFSNNNEPTSHFSSDIVREIVLPEIEKEVNEGKNFAPLRQIFHSLILATWFKKHLKTSLVNQVYADQGKVRGIDLASPGSTQSIYQMYVDTFKKGIYDFIRIEQDPYEQKPVSRKYFSGGFFSSDSDQWIDSRAMDSPSLIDQKASRIYHAPGTVKVQLIPETGKSEKNSSGISNRAKGLRKFFVIAAFSIMVGVVAPFSNLFAGTSTDRYVGERYGNPLYQTEDGRAYSVVPKWGDPSKATGTVSGIGAAAVAYAEEIGINIPQGATLYWDVINSIADANNISPSSGYLIHPGDTLWIPTSVTKKPVTTPSTPRRSQAFEKQNSYQAPSYEDATNNAPDTQTVRFDPSNSSQSSVSDSTSGVNTQDRSAIDQAIAEHVDLQQTRSQIDSLQQKIDVLEQEISKLIDQGQDSTSKVIAIGNPPPPEEDSLKIELTQANQNIAYLMQQLDDLKEKKKKIQIDFERKVEVKLNMKEGVGTLVSKGGDAKFTFRHGNTKLEANFKFEGNMQPGSEGQNVYIKKHFLIEQDSIFGQPFKLRAGWHTGNATNPYFFGFDTYPHKLFSNDLLWSLGLDAYYPLVSHTDEPDGVTQISRQRMYMPRAKIDWKINPSTTLSLKGEGAYSQDPFTRENFQDEEFTLSLKLKDKKGENTFSLIRGFDEPKMISHLTSLSTDPGPYRLGYERGFKVAGAKGAIGGSWAFDDHLATQGAKIWLKFNGPLDFAKWQKEKFGSLHPGVVFSSETDFALNPKVLFDDPDPLMTYGDMEFGINFKEFLGTSGDLYLGLRSDLYLQGPDLQSAQGEIAKPKLNIEYDFVPENNDFSSIHFGLRQGHPMVGITLSHDGKKRFVMVPEANFYYFGKTEYSSGLAGEIDFVSGVRFSENISLWANPRALWAMEGNLSLGGSLTLLMRNYGIEFFKDFNAHPDLLRDLGYLPYGYDWRIGPIVNFPSFSGGLFYGQEKENGFIGIRASLKINKTPRDNRHFKIRNDFLNQPYEKRSSDVSNKSSSALLLAKDNIFAGTVGESNLSPWTLLKERLKNAHLMTTFSGDDPSLSSHVVFINAFGRYDNVVSQVQEAIEDLKPQQLIYLTIELHNKETIHHAAVLTDVRSLLGPSEENAAFNEILVGAGESLSKHLFYIHAEEVTLTRDIFIKTFFFQPFVHGQILYDEKLKEVVFQNLAHMLHKKFSKKRVFITIPSDDLWLQSRIRSYFDGAKIHSFTKFNNTMTLQAPLGSARSEHEAVSADLVSSSSPIGGIDLQGNFIRVDQGGVSDAPNITVDNTSFDAMSIMGFTPVIINIVPFVGFYSFFDQTPDNMPQLAASKRS